MNATDTTEELDDESALQFDRWGNLRHLLTLARLDTAILQRVAETLGVR